ncbi:uncharacterized protein NECHADRAFT_80248 [Fusarium vanettenii 77-13-4]|uniref:Uncharacterized protein n=1 Tax=Fusarium vanettenii (strain ATCC MYA-4622 / CBS 123669 / FGSC 9596 / NRRL 45880 / 77-13-4) TaxID=660122 RepID=C7YTB6_FUSV7|nr:uncharacterized protein NECHADRAFT_80248 [Fusarium vanettenii 77-13-4]EEU45006.1 predicted protein [Fusarium vanettenii 77-13-4]
MCVPRPRPFGSFQFYPLARGRNCTALQLRCTAPFDWTCRVRLPRFLRLPPAACRFNHLPSHHTATVFFLFQSSLADDLILDTFASIYSPRLRDRQHVAADTLALRATIR